MDTSSSTKLNENNYSDLDHMIMDIGVNVVPEEYSYGWTRDSDLYDRYDNLKTAILDENKKPLIVHRGGILNNSSPNFFSESKSFSENYSQFVDDYFIEILKPFDSLNSEHLQVLIDRVGYLVDEYNNEEYTDPNDILSGILSSDTWGFIEPHLELIRQLGFDGVKMTEDGYINYITFDIKQAVLANNFNKNLVNENSGKTFIQGNRDFHRDEDILPIDKLFLNKIKGHDGSVCLFGAFEGESINDIETVLEYIGAEYEKINELTVGTGEVYKLTNAESYLSHIMSEIEDFNLKDFDELIEYLPISNIKNYTVDIGVFLLENPNFDIDDDVENDVLREWIELVLEGNSKQDIIDELINRKSQSLSGKYYHGTAVENEEELEDINNLELSYSDLGAVYVSEDRAPAEVFSESRVMDETPNGVVLEMDLDMNNIYIVDINSSNTIMLEGSEYDVAGDRELYFEHLERIGFNGAIVRDNYGAGASDIAIFDDIDLSDAKKYINKNNEWIEHNPETPEPVQKKIKNKRGFK